MSQLEFGYVDPSTVRDNENNWRKHPDKQSAAMQKIYDAVGDAGAAVVNERTVENGWTPEQCGRVFLDGHLRKKVKTKRGEQIPVVIGQWTPEQERRIIGTYDVVTGMADFDADIVKALSQDEFIKAIQEQDERLRALLGTQAKQESGAPVDLKEQWMILIECLNEQEQNELLQRFIEEGLNCRALTS